MKRIAIYCRVSTDRQDLESQKHAIELWLTEKRPAPTQIHSFEDAGYSGKNTNRPGFRKLMTLAMKGQIDTIVVYRLDRFSRDANTAIRTILELDLHGVAFVSITQPILNLGHEMPFRRTLLAAFAELAEMEREAIVSRVKAGIAAAKKRGVKMGAPLKVTVDKQAFARELRSSGTSFKDIALQLGLGVGTVHRMVNGPDIFPCN